MPRGCVGPQIRVSFADCASGTVSLPRYCNLYSKPQLSMSAFPSYRQCDGMSNSLMIVVMFHCDSCSSTDAHVFD